MKKILTLSIMAVLCANAGAQTMNSGYFLDNYNLGHQINPAHRKADEINSYFGLGIGNINAAAQANIGASSLLFPVDGKLVFGLNEKVPADEFLGKLKSVNKVRAGLNLSLFNLGIKTGKTGFLTFDIGIRSQEDISVPKSLFEMLKLGVKDGNSYAIKDINGWAANYIELAAGYSMDFGDRLRGGVRLKFLFGLAQAEMNVNNLSVRMDKESGKTFTSGDGTLGIACPLITLGKTGDKYDLNSLGFGKFGLAGFGVGVDLGAIWTPVEDLDIDFAVQDIGSIGWNTNTSGVMNYKDRELAGGSKINMDDLLDFRESACSKVSTFLPTTFRIGARYKMPFYKNLSARILGSVVAGKHSSYSDLRIGATITPVKNVSATVNYGLTTYGSTMGAALNLNLGFFNFYVGADSLVNKVTPQYIPVNPFGLTVTTGVIIQIKNRRKA